MDMLITTKVYVWLCDALEACLQFVEEGLESVRDDNAVPASVRGSPLKWTRVISPKGLHVLSRWL